MGTHMRELSESCPINTNMTGFRRFSWNVIRRIEDELKELVKEQVIDQFSASSWDTNEFAETLINDWEQMTRILFCYW